MGSPRPPSFSDAVEMSKERFEAVGMSDIKETSRRYKVNIMARHAEALSFGDGWRGTSNIRIKVPDGALSIPELLKKADLDPLSFEAAAALSASLLERGDPLPDEMRQWTIEVLKGKVAPKTPPDQLRGFEGANSLRDLYVALAVYDLVEKGMKPTRNPGSPATSACDAVATALAELKLRPMSYSAVYAIWLEFKKP